MGRYLLVFWWLFWAIPSSVLALETTPAVRVFVIDSVQNPSAYWNNCASNVVRPVLDGFVGRDFVDSYAAAAAVDAAMPDTDNCVGAPDHASRIYVARGSDNSVSVRYQRVLDGASMFWTLVGTVSLKCPDDSYTLNTTNNICERKCTPPLVWSTAQNKCIDACEQYRGVESYEGLMIDPTKFHSFCDSNRCAWEFSRSDKSSNGYVIDTLAYPAFDVWSKGAGACTNQGTKENSKANDPKPTKPPCPASSGVLTSSSGTVACVPEGTPNAPKPDVTKTKKRETFPDGSTKDTETTKTRDPSTGAEHVSSSSTSSGGMSGSPGTTSTDESSSGSSGGEDDGDGKGQCAKEPDSPMCKKGEVKGKGRFESGEQDGKIADARQRLSDKVSEISSAIKGQFGQVGVGGGGLPCYAPVSILGTSFNLCFSIYSGQLSVIGAIVMLIAALLSAFIILRG